MYDQKLRQQVPAAGSFASVPAAFEATTDGLKHILKMEFTTGTREDRRPNREREEFSSPGLQLETAFTTDWCMVDLGAVDPSAIEAARIIADCDFVKDVVQRHPQEVMQMIQAFQPTAPLERIDEAIKIAKDIGFTEEDSVKAGGGLLFLVAVVAGAALLGGCAHCNSHAKGKKTTPSR